MSTRALPICLLVLFACTEPNGAAVDSQPAAEDDVDEFVPVAEAAEGVLINEIMAFSGE